MTATLRHRLEDDRGLTLAELLVAIVILGLIGGTVGMALTVWLRQENRTAERLRAARETQTLINWFAPDVQSATGLTTTGEFDPTDCGGAFTTFGSNRLRMALHPAAPTAPGAPTPASVVSYRLDSANGRLVRVACAGGTVRSDVVMTGVTGVTPQVTANVARLTVTTTFGPAGEIARTIVVSAARRNP